MFARIRLMSVVLAAGAFMLTSGCQTPNAAQKDGAQPKQAPTGAKESTSDEKPVDVPPARIQARTFLAAARLHESQNRPLPAVQQYEYALAEDPQNVHILNRIGTLYDQLGNSAAAEKAYKQALKIEPNNAMIHNNLAFSYILRQRWDDAETELVHAIELSPDFARARINMGMVLGQTNRFDDSLRQFQMVLPPDEAHYNIGLMYQSKRKAVEAAAAYKRALEANPKLVAAQEQLKRMPAEVLGAADRKIEEARQAELAANMPAAAPDAVQSSATQPAIDMTDLPTVPYILDGWPDDYLKGMMADAIEWVPSQVRELAEVIQVGLPATQPSFQQIAIRRPAPFSAELASELDLPVSVWPQTPELITDMRELSLVSIADDTSAWLDCQASPSAAYLETPVQAVTTQPVAQSVNPE